MHTYTIKLTIMHCKECTFVKYDVKYFLSFSQLNKRYKNLLTLTTVYTAKNFSNQVTQFLVIIAAKLFYNFTHAFNVTVDYSHFSVLDIYIRKCNSVLEYK